MGSLITFGPENKPLEMFSTPHLAAISAIVLLCILLIVFKGSLQNGRFKLGFRYFMAAFIMIQQILLYVWYVRTGEWSISWTLPIQLCDISIFLSAFALVKKNFYIYELLYFWGFGGATQAILTPDTGNFTFPHFVFYQFFLGHGLILLTCLYIILVENFRPTLKSIFRTFVITNIYAMLIFPVNYLTGGNYLFLRFKPPGESIMSLLGPWPWYLLELEAVALILFLLLYLPFAFTTSRKDTPVTF